jgi:hypothetical protein
LAKGVGFISQFGHPAQQWKAVEILANMELFPPKMAILEGNMMYRDMLLYRIMALDTWRELLATA